MLDCDYRLQADISMMAVMEGGLCVSLMEAGPSPSYVKGSFPSPSLVADKERRSPPCTRERVHENL